jgi:hypothetical protein
VENKRQNYRITIVPVLKQQRQIPRAFFGDRIVPRHTTFSSEKGRLIEIGRCYGMETYVEKTRLKKISRQQTPLKTTIDQKI